MKTNRNRILVNILLAVLIALSFLNLGYETARDFEISASEEITASMAVVAGIQAVLAPLSKSIPVIGGLAAEYGETMDKLEEYLALSNAMVLVQVTLLEVSRSLYIKFFMVLLFIGLWIPKTQGLAFKLLVLALVISPGLNLYVNAMHSVSEETRLELGTSLRTELQQTADTINAHHLLHQSKLDSLEAEQKAKHEGRLTLGERVEDGLVKATYSVEDEVEKIGMDLADVLKYSGSKALQLAINLMVNIVVVFVLMPLVFWYIISLLLKKYFIYNRSGANPPAGMQSGDKAPVSN